MNNPCGPVPLLFITGFLGSGKTFHQLSTYRLEFGGIHFSIGLCNVETFRFDTEYLFCILFISQYDITAGYQLGHDF